MYEIYKCINEFINPLYNMCFPINTMIKPGIHDCSATSEVQSLPLSSIKFRQLCGVLGFWTSPHTPWRFFQDKYFSLISNICLLGILIKWEEGAISVLSSNPPPPPSPNKRATASPYIGSWICHIRKGVSSPLIMYCIVIHLNTCYT